MKMVLMSVSVRLLRILACLLALVAAAACASAEPATTTEPKQPGQLRIVAAFYPFQFVAQRVAGDHATVASLTEPGAEPHDLELTPRQVASLTTANLVIYEKGFQPAVDEAVAQSDNPEVIDTRTVVPPPLRNRVIMIKEMELSMMTRLDPHVWLDPTACLRSLAVAERLSTLDPDHAADYARNADALTKSYVWIGRSARTGALRAHRVHHDPRCLRLPG